MKTSKIIFIILTSFLLTFVGCATKSAEVSQVSQKDFETAITKDLQISTLENPSAASAALTNTAVSADTRSMVVGVWRAQHYFQGIPCVSEWIYEDNGAYSGMTQCGNYAMQRTGEWSLPDSNTIRVSLKDGKLIRWDSWKFRMLDRNRMALGDGAIVAYRMQ